MATISAIIPAYNAEATLPRCLAALERERLAGAPLAEIIVVDDASGDGTATIAEAAGARTIKLASNSGDARARNAGAAAATGDLLWFLDADVEPRPGCAARLSSFMDENPQVDAAIGSYDDAPSAPGLCSQFKNLMHHHVHQQAGERVSTFWTGCGVVRRTAFERIGGFDDDFWPGATIADMHFGYEMTRRGMRIAMLNDVQATHHKRWTLFSMIRTDLMQRAIPWTILLRRHAGLGQNELNLGRRAKAGVAAAWILVFAGVLGFFAPSAWIAVPFALGAVGYAHSPFLAFLARRRGGFFALRCFPLLVLYGFYCGLGFLAGTLCYGLGLRPRRRFSA